MANYFVILVSNLVKEEPFLVIYLRKGQASQTILLSLTPNKRLLPHAPLFGNIFIEGQALHKQYCQTSSFLVIYLNEGQTQRLPHSPQGDNNEKTKSQEYRRKLLPYSKQMYLQSVFTGGYR